MKKSVYVLKSKVMLWPGEQGVWHFIAVDRGPTAEIRAAYVAVRRGFGSLPVEATIGKTTWRTSIFPTKEGFYFLPLKAKVRKAEDLFEGDTVSFTIRICP